jgi:hypothetical protein
MNINGNLNLFNGSLGGLKLSKNDVGSSAMKTTVMSPEEKAVEMNFLLEQERKNKEELRKAKKIKVEEKKCQQLNTKKIEDKVIERDPLKLLKLF